MKPRIVFVHGNGSSHWSFAWAAWLQHELASLGFPTFFETMPDSVLARAQYWLPFLQNQAKVRASDVIVGWSSGAVAAMRYAENHIVLGSVLVSPCYTDLGDAMEKQSGYYDAPWQWSSIKANQCKIAIFSSSSDPHIPSEQFAFIAKRLNAEWFNLPGAGHFTDRQTFPELLTYIRENYLNVSVSEI